MHAETVAALVRSHKQILRCEEHLAAIHRRLQATSHALANSLRLIDGGEAAFSVHQTIAPPDRKPSQADRLVMDGRA